MKPAKIDLDRSAMSAAGETFGLLEHPVFEIAHGVSGVTGENFFRSLARGLARALDADYVLIGALQPSLDRISTLAVWGNGSDAHPFEYDLADTPCANVMEKRPCSYPSGVQHLFPKDIQLAEMGVEGYVGSPMIDSSGRCLGLICSLTRRPLANSTVAEALLQIFASRAVAELERKNYEDALAQSEAPLGSTHWIVEGPNGAAEILRINASTLRSRMKRLGIRRPA
jgi:hypothetical protein